MKRILAVILCLVTLLALALVWHKKENDNEKESTEEEYVYVSFPKTVLFKTSTDEGEIWYTFNEQGNVLERSDREGRVVTFIYDEKGKLISGCVDGAEWQFRYDTTGSMVVGDMHEWGFIWKFDNDGNLKQRDSDLGWPSESFSYDKNGNITKIERISNPSGVIGKLEYIYDDKGLLTSVKSQGETIAEYEYVFDEYGNLTGAYKDGEAIPFQRDYDAGGNLLYYRDDVVKITYQVIKIAKKDVARVQQNYMLITYDELLDHFPYQEVCNPTCYKPFINK